MIDIFSIIANAHYIDDEKYVDNLRNAKIRGVYHTTKYAVKYYNLQHLQEPTILRTKEDLQLLPFSILTRKHSV